ncbi:MAG TPA: SAM-dependent methyltransferase, partial [Bryobacteraceae bacterium]|nr:SAM-dependent methyltransferase [Bryobacteraceae bacterium]
MHEALEKRQEELASPRVSFRDPGGAVVRDGSHIYRVVAPEAASTLRSFLATATAARWQSNGGFVTTFPVDNPHAGHAIAAPICQERGWDLHDVFVAEHGVIPFVSYPWEWAPCMLGAAADLTLRLADELLDEGYGLKDATPLNVLFRGPQPVLVDVLSVERRDPGAAHWLAHGQFVRTFLLPLA